MKKKITFFGLIIILVCMGIVGCKKKDENSAPIILTITSMPSTSAESRILGGDKVTISVTASDPEQQEIIYSYECGYGSFIGQSDTSEIVWRSPVGNENKEYEIIANVSDGEAMTSKSIIIYVDKEALPTGKIEGFVYYANTTVPVSDVLVSVSDFTTNTDNDGYYSIPNVPVGNQPLMASKEGYDTYSAMVIVEPGSTSRKIEMTSSIFTNTLYGTITDSITGSIISFVDLVLLNPDSSDSYLITQSDLNGTFHLPTVPEGQHKVRLSHNQYFDKEVTIEMDNTDLESNLVMVSCQPIVSTGTYSNPYPIKLEFEGNVISIGCSNITKYGHCWSTNPDPTINDNIAEFGYLSTAGSFTSEIAVEEGTLYYFRAYAVNSYGTTYGEQVSLTTSVYPDCGIVNYGGKNYKTVQIGTQCWMKENLNYQVSGSRCYDDNPANCQIYGRLYTWNAAIDGDWADGSNSVPSGERGVCPIGWHLPSTAEWNILRDYLGGGTVAGGKLKKTGTEFWNSPNTGASNSSGFSALPGGCFDFYGNPSFLQKAAYFWTSWCGYSNADNISLFNSNTEVYLNYDDMDTYRSVRCLKD